MGEPAKISAEGQMPGPLNPDEKSRTMQMVVFPKWEAVVDEWRRVQPDNPNRSEAIRRMVLLAAGIRDPKAWLEAMTPSPRDKPK